MANKTLTITKPDDFHCHFRDGEALLMTIPHTARCFARAIAMPNLKPPVTTVAEALDYRERILKAIPKDVEFTPLMTLYLTPNTTPEEILSASKNPHIYAVKYYPAGATTHSEAGIKGLESQKPVLAAMEKAGLPLLVHGEVTDPSVDIFDREAVFLKRELAPTLEAFPNLRVVVEHITTQQAVDFVQQAGDNVAATITVHHLLLNRNDLLVGGVHPHYYCLPVLKRRTHQEALREAATSGNRKFFLGTDSAPHARNQKESACGCAGIYTAPIAIELYAEIFDECGALNRLEGFASHFGAQFYRLPLNKTSITLEKKEWMQQESYPLRDHETVVPLRASQTIQWRLKTPR